MRILIKNGRLLDPETNMDKVADLLTDGDRIIRIAADIEEEADQLIDASGCYVMPGFIDLHVHLRDPGFEYKETLASGGAAAVRGGFTTVCAMPNTKPVMDTPEKIQQVQQRAEEESPAHVYQLGAITIGQQGTRLADIAGMAAAGTMAISEDGKSVMDADLYKTAMKAAAKADIPIFAHCEDINLVAGGVMNADAKAEQLGLPGITNAVEDIIVERDIRLAGETGARLHLCHCSTRDSVRLLREAKEAGLPVTGEVCPHHFTLSTDDISADDGNYKMNPPLRSKDDVEALKQALKDGTLDVIATDHAPHSEEEKQGSMKEAMFGIIGSETAAALTYTELVIPGILSMMQMADRMSYGPAKILRIDKGRLQEGKIADITIFNPDASYKIDMNEMVSRSKNTPFQGRDVRGRVEVTIADGRIVYGG